MKGPPNDEEETKTTILDEKKLPKEMMKIKERLDYLETFPHKKSPVSSEKKALQKHLTDMYCLMLLLAIYLKKILVKAYLHGTTLSHATSLRQAYDMTWES